MAGYSPLAIANEFLEMAEDRGIPLTPMHLQKLVYIAHGWNLAIHDEPLTRGALQAWDWGPVYPDLYDATKKYGGGAVPGRIHENNWAALDHIKGKVVRARMSDDEKELLAAVFDNYGDLEAWQLSALTHNEGTPWSNAYQPGRKNAPIDDKDIKKHFYDLASAEPAAEEA